jgi:hypothetical protein
LKPIANVLPALPTVLDFELHCSWTANVTSRPSIEHMGAPPLSSGVLLQALAEESFTGCPITVQILGACCCLRAGPAQAMLVDQQQNNCFVQASQLRCYRCTLPSHA